MGEKRDRGRKRKRVKVRFGIDKPQKIAFTDDISSEGLFIKTASPEQPGGVLQLEITLPDETLILCKGRIHWAKKVPVNLLRAVGKGGMGIRIGDFSGGEEVYQRFVESLQR